MEGAPHAHSTSVAIHAAIMHCLLCRVRNADRHLDRYRFVIIQSLLTAFNGPGPVACSLTA